MGTEIKVGPSGSVALKFTFGWLLCGRYGCDCNERHTIVEYDTTHCFPVLKRVEVEKNDSIIEVNSTQESNSDASLNSLLRISLT